MGSTIDGGVLADLRVRCANLPRADGWTAPRPVHRAFSRFGLRLNLVGLTATRADGQQAIGAAACAEDTGGYQAAFLRASFELLERMGLYDAVADVTRDSYTLQSHCRRHHESVTREQLFPSAEPDAPFRYAHESGVALGDSFSDACERAHAELCERDAILRSWFGQHRPVLVRLPRGRLPAALMQRYELVLARFQSDSRYGCCGLFAFPKHDRDPLVFGFGAAFNWNEAVDKAQAEMLQRLGFLWGAALKGALPEVSKHPAYHQAYYLHPDHHGVLKSWLRDGHRDWTKRSTSTNLTAGFVDMTPAQLTAPDRWPTSRQPGPARPATHGTETGRLYLVKAFDPARAPLVFGHGHPWFHPPDHQLLSDAKRSLHPIP